MLASLLLFFPGRKPFAVRSFPPSSLARVTLGIFFFFQLTLPLRHHVFEGNVAWTEEGHKFSWRMKLRDKRAEARFILYDPKSGHWELHDPRTLLSHRQYRKMCTRPNLAFQYAQYLQKLDEGAGRKRAVHALVMASLNGRPFQWIIDPRRDLTQETSSLFAHDEWIYPFRENAKIGIYPDRPSQTGLLSAARRALPFLKDGKFLNFKGNFVSSTN